MYCGTRNLYKHMITATKSLLYHNKIDKIYFLIEDDKFPYPLPHIIECINVSNLNIFSTTGPNYNSYWTYMVLMRAALTKVLPQDLDIVLSLDVDTLIIDNIEELWNIDLSNYYLAGVLEPDTKTICTPYINCGVVLFNLKKIRKDKMDDKIINQLNTKFYRFKEQDCINDLCHNNIKLISSNYNVCNFTEPPTELKIIHYAATGVNFWSKQGDYLYYKNKMWNDILKI